MIEAAEPSLARDNKSDAPDMYSAPSAPSLHGTRGWAAGARGSLVLCSALGNQTLRAGGKPYKGGFQGPNRGKEQGLSKRKKI